MAPVRVVFTASINSQTHGALPVVIELALHELKDEGGFSDSRLAQKDTVIEIVQCSTQYELAMGRDRASSIWSSTLDSDDSASSVGRTGGVPVRYDAQGWDGIYSLKELTLEDAPALVVVAMMCGCVCLVCRRCHKL